MNKALDAASLAIEVKQIFVDGITVKADLGINCLTKTGAILKTITVTAGDDLYPESNFAEPYKTGFFIEHVNGSQKTITFSNGLCLAAGERYEK